MHAGMHAYMHTYRRPGKCAGVCRFSVACDHLCPGSSNDGWGHPSQSPKGSFRGISWQLRSLKSSFSNKVTRMKLWTYGADGFQLRHNCRDSSMPHGKTCLVPWNPSPTVTELGGASRLSEFSVLS